MATMRPVDLDDVNPGEPEPIHRRARRSRRRIALAAVAGLAVAGLVSAQLVLDARQRGYEAEFDGLPGAVWQLEDPAPRWMAPGYDPRVNGARVRDVIVAAWVEPDGEVTVNGYALRTGTPRWSTHLQVPRTVFDGFRRGEGDSFDRGVECRTSARRGGRDARAVCVIGGEPVGTHSDGDRDALLVAVDASGRVHAQRTVPDTYWAVRGTHVQLATMRRTGDQQSVDVVEQTWGGDVVWSADLGTTDAVDPAGDVDIIAQGITTDGTWTVVNTGTRAFVLDEHGTVAGDVPTGGTGAALVSGGALWLADYSSHTPGGRLVLPRAIGLTLPRVPSEAQPQPLRVSIDDGSAPNLVPVQVGSSLLGVDTRTGEPAWTTALHGEALETVLLDGIVFIAHGSQVTALDAATGQQRWDAALPFSASSLTTDGRRLIATSDALVVLDPRDGSVVSRQDAAALMPEQSAQQADSVAVYSRYGLLVLQTVAGGDVSDDIWVIS